MNDYFDQLEHELRGAVTRRAHLRWYKRFHVPVRHRGLAVVIAALVIAAPSVAAFGAASGWFSAGSPDRYYPASATSGLGKVLPAGDRLLPIRVADPDGGPPWGIRLVRTTRGDTCIQVGRVQDGQIGALGIDGAWGDDHEFHEIKPNDGLADICGATDATGYGFANQTAHGAPASVDVPLYNSSGGARNACRSPYESITAPVPGGGSNPSPLLKKLLQQAAKQRSSSPVCPADSMRTVFAGLLGPDAKRITYKTPDGKTMTENTSGGVGAYLIVFKETVTNCAEFSTSALGGSRGCQSGGTGNSPDLQWPTAVTSVKYKDGNTCKLQPSTRVVNAYEKLVGQSRNQPHETTKQEQARFEEFLVAYHLTRRTWIQALIPRCPPVGWVAAKQAVTAAQVATPLHVTISSGRRFCSKGPWPANSVQDTTIVCDHRIPQGYTSYYESGPKHRLFALIRVSFTAREPVTTSNSFYAWNIQEPGNHGSESNRTQANVRPGETVTFTIAEAVPETHSPDAPRGVYHGTITFEPNAGQAGPDDADGAPGQDGALTVGTFSLRLPPNS
jgi:hypothetical protein